MRYTKKLFLLAFLFPLILFAQRTVTGKITDSTDFPLPGASVQVKGTSIGTITDFDGAFSINLEKTPSTIVISFMGYETKELEITNQKSITIALKQDSQQLEEVVVIGYGSVNRKDLTGAVTSIKPTTTITEQSKGLEDIIKGRSAGVQVSSNGSEPGSTTSIKIRGLSSLTANTEPLYVVDGIIMDSATEDTTDPISGYTPPQGGGLYGVNPADIESIEILKDASATAIYGSRAANGVVIITTKKGKRGKAKFNFTTSLSIGKVVRNIDVLDTRGYANYVNDVRASVDWEPAYTIDENGNIFTTGIDVDPVEVVGIDWAEDTYRTSMLRKNRLSISGGGETGDYYLSGGMVSNQGTFPNALAEALDFNLNINQNLSDKFKIGVKIATTYTDLSSSKGPDEYGGANNSMVRQVILAAPMLNFVDNNQDPNDIEEELDGPRAWVADYDDDAQEVRVLGAITMDYKFSKAFKYRLRFGGDYRNKERSFWYGKAIRKGNDPNGLAGLSTLNRFRYNIDNTLTFNKSFNKNNRINATIGALIDKTSLYRTRYSASDFADHSLRADGISFGAVFSPLVIDSEYPTIISFISRINYTLFNRYLLTGTIRADGSSKFAQENQWGYFPAVSFAWKASEEAFLRDSKTISNLKLRLGYGEVGNQNIPPYSYLTPFGATNSALSDATGGSLIAVVPQNLANPDLVWEKAVQYNAGIDFGFFDDRINGTVDVYHKNSTDLLLKIALGPTAGFNFLTANQGDIENKGLEISLNTDIIKKDNLSWNVFANVSFNKNKISGLGQINAAEFGNLGEVTAFLGTPISGGSYFKQPANIYIEGREAGLFYGYETNGIIRTEEQLISTATGDPLQYGGTDLRVGDVYFVDQNGDGNITDADKTIIGNPNPDYTFGLGSSFDYKDFSLSLMFNGVYGNDIANGNLFQTAYANGSTKNVRVIAYEDAFNADTNPNGAYPLVGVGEVGVDYTRDFNDRMIENGSFLRLSYVTLGYSIPVEHIDFIDGIKISFSGQNLWLLTDYSGFDPEVNSFAYDPTRTGIDWGSFPNQRTFTFGINASF